MGKKKNKQAKIAAFNQQVQQHTVQGLLIQRSTDTTTATNLARGFVGNGQGLTLPGNFGAQYAALYQAQGAFSPAASTSTALSSSMSLASMGHMETSLPKDFVLSMVACINTTVSIQTSLTISSTTQLCLLNRPSPCHHGDAVK